MSVIFEIKKFKMVKKVMSPKVNIKEKQGATKLFLKITGEMCLTGTRKCIKIM